MKFIISLPDVYVYHVYKAGQIIEPCADVITKTATAVP